VNDHPRVLVSVTKLRPEEHLLLAALRSAGLDAQPVTALQVAQVLNRAVPAPHAVLLRNLSHAELAGMCHRFAQAGIRTVNTPAAVTLCLSKDLQALAFRRAGVPHPDTRLAFSVAQVRDELEHLGGDAVVKPVSGSWGRGIVRIRDDAQFDAWAGGRDGLDPAGRAFPVLVQQYVPKPGYNERVHVIGDTAVVAYRQISDGFRTNTRLGGRVEPIAVSPRSRELCARIVGCLGPGVYGIDLAESADTGELFVLEVNSSPDFASSSGIHGVDIAGLVAGYLKTLIGEEAGPAAGSAGPRQLAGAGASWPAG
jgi:[lysine-biosynthesis-protein LysW]--L-2-aminoadipate ligase